MMPMRSYSVEGTFKYSIHASPVWHDETSVHPLTLDLFYDSKFEIVEKELADANLKFLKVTSTNRYSNHLDITASSRVDSAWRHKVIFDARFHGPEVPHPSIGRCIIDINDLILELNVTNGEITIKLYTFLDDIEAYVPELEWRGAAIMNKSNGSISVISITIQNGKPTQVESGNITTTQTAILGFSEWSVEDTLELYNPNIIQIKEMIPVLSTIGIVALIISAILIYTRAHLVVGRINNSKRLDLSQ